MAASKGKPCVRPIPINYIRFFTAFQGKPQKNCLPAKRPGDRKDVCLCLFALRSGEAVQDGCELAAGGGAGGQELAVGAVDEALADSPLHGGNGVAADAGVILKADEVLGERHGVHALIDGVAEQELRKLLTGDGLVRLKGRGGRAAGDLVLGGPGDGCFIIAAGGNVGERGILSHFGAARKTVERCDDHGAGHGPVRREGISAGSGHQSLIRAEQNVLLADRLGLDIREAGSGQQRAQQEQQRAPCQKPFHDAPFSVELASMARASSAVKS